MNDELTPTKRSAEFLEWDQKARQLISDLNEQRGKWGAIYRRSLLKRKIWQTAVVIATSVSTGLAGYLASQDTPIEWRIALAIIVAIAGAVSSVRDVWQVNETADDARDRYNEVKSLTAELEKVRFDVAGQIRESETLPKLRGSVEHVAERLKEIKDDLVNGKPSKDAAVTSSQ